MALSFAAHTTPHTAAGQTDRCTYSTAPRDSLAHARTHNHQTNAPFHPTTITAQQARLSCVSWGPRCSRPLTTDEAEETYTHACLALQERSTHLRQQQQQHNSIFLSVCSLSRGRAAAVVVEVPPRQRSCSVRARHNLPQPTPSRTYSSRGPSVFMVVFLSYIRTVSENRAPR